MDPKVHSHTPSSLLLLQALKQSLPYSIPIYYRIQHQNQTPHTHILATFPPSTDPTASTSSHFAVIYLDRSKRPETELWAFASGQIPGHESSSSSKAINLETEVGATVTSPPFCAECKACFLALIKHIPTLPIPPLDPANEKYLQLAQAHAEQYPELKPLSPSTPSTPGLFLRQLLYPSVMTFGTVHQSLAAIAFEAGAVREEFLGLESPLNKFIFRIADLPATRPLPKGLRWGEMRPQDMDVVQARTPIPRSARTLLSMKSVGVFDEKTNEPVAWTFLGLDGSLTSLHTEAEWRGKGIAKMVAARCFTEYLLDVTKDEHGDVWGHADVYYGNVQSESVCRSLGGKPLWTAFWMRLDPDRLKKTP